MEIYRKALELVSDGKNFALGTVVWAQGSTPQKAGSKAILDSQGTLWGTLGGGLVESEGLDRMKKSIEDGRPELFEYRLDEAYSREAGPICGGLMRIFANPRMADNSSSYAAALDAVEARQRGVLVTAVEGAADVGAAAWRPETEFSGNGEVPSGEDLRRCLLEERPLFVVTQDGRKYFVEPVFAAPRLLIVGGGHVGQAAALQGSLLGFEVTVVDDREEFASPELFPDEVQTICGDIRTEVGRFPKEKDTYIVLVSKGHRPDAEALEACVHSEVAYLGMIGSRRKIASIREHFIADGFATAAEFDRVVAPIGLGIGAVTVPEIGVSIAAQLVAARRLGSKASAQARDPE